MNITFFNPLTFQKGHPRKIVVGVGDEKLSNITYYPLAVFHDLHSVGPSYLVEDSLSIPTNFWYTAEMMDEDLVNISKSMPFALICVYDGYNITLYLDGEMEISTPNDKGKYQFKSMWAVDFPWKKVI